MHQGPEFKTPQNVARPARFGAAPAAPKPAAVRYNDWQRLSVPTPAAFRPIRPVSVVIPYSGGAAPLARTLAALERQTYPVGLFEVIVVDDASPQPLARPSDTPLDLRILREDDVGHGAAWARNRGVRAARHDILVFLDGDVIAEAGLLAAHARWHHAVADAVSLGFSAYVSAAGVDAADVRRWRGPLRQLFAGRPFDRPLPERHVARTGNLSSRHDDIFRITDTNNLGVRKALFNTVGGFDESFTRSSWEDTEFGYRAYARGAVLIPVRDAAAWHQERFVANLDPAKRAHKARERVTASRLIPHPDFRPARAPDARVPRTVVTVRAAGRSESAIAETVAALLAGDDRDLAVRIEVPACAGLARRLEARYAGGAPVRVATGSAALDDYPVSPLHVALPAGAPAGRDLLRQLRAGLGDAATATAHLGGGATAAVARCWALHRAERTGLPAAAFGDTAAIDIRSARRWQRSLPTHRQRFRGPLGRAFDEACRIRSRRDAARFFAWLGGGLRWWILCRRGLGGHGKRED